MSTEPENRPEHDDNDPPEEISLTSEFVLFLRENKKWWLIPLILGFLGMAALLLLSTNPATAPFIYSIF